MLIKAYGELWNPFVTDWKAKQLVGRGLPKKYRHEINFWEAKGIYVLLRDFRPVYVGKSWADRIGPRLFEHLSDRFVGRWDMFSWYSVSKPNKTSKDVNSPENRPVHLKTAIATLESLTILVTDPPLNRKRERIPGATEFEQVGDHKPKTTVQYLEEIHGFTKK